MCLLCLCRSEEAVETESAPSAGYKSSDPAGRDDFSTLNPVKDDSGSDAIEQIDNVLCSKGL